MAPRFDRIRFNLMRAIELFEDMNHEDMDVTAPPSDGIYSKEKEVAEYLNECLDKMIAEGMFDLCSSRVAGSPDYDDNLPSTPRSGGFDVDEQTGSSSRSRDDELDELDERDEQRDSSESFTDRFKRYIKRMLPTLGRRRKHREGRSEAGADQHYDGGSTEYAHDDGEDYHEETPYDPASRAHQLAPRDSRELLNQPSLSGQRQLPAGLATRSGRSAMIRDRLRRSRENARRQRLRRASRASSRSSASGARRRRRRRSSSRSPGGRRSG